MIQMDTTDTETADEGGSSSPLDERMALQEINISNTNADSQIVLNDLRLLELLCLYPFLLTKSSAQQNIDYHIWGWEQVAKAFNESYEGIPLSTPFSTAELQWRWEIMRPLINSLARAKGQIPKAMWKVVVNINNRMNGEKTKETRNTKCQDLVLSQLPFVEELSHSQRLRLEVEVLDLIMDEERRSLNLYDDISTMTKRTVQSEYDQFFATIKVKELPPDTLKRLATDNSSSSASSQTPKIRNANETGLVISNVFSKAQEVTNGTNVTEIKTEPVEPEACQAPMFAQEVTVPLSIVKELCKNVRVRLRRLDLDDYMPLSSIRRSTRFSGKN